MNDEMIMFDSPQAAHPCLHQGWHSRDGYFYPDERTARYTGCTHRPCEECGAPTLKTYPHCEACRSERERARYEARPEAPWDGKQMVYSETLDRYYPNPDEAWEEADDEGIDLASMRLVLCDPLYARQLDVDDFADEMPEDGDAPDELVAAMNAFNSAVSGLILSWYPGKTRLGAEEAQD